MKNTFGQSVAVTLFGESHGSEIGAVIDGLAPGLSVDEDFIRHQLSLRRPHGKISTARVEADEFRIVSGVFEGRTTGTPLCILIPNTSTRSGDYSKGLPRPGHADFTAQCKYHGYQDYRGGGHFSGRLTAPLCIVGGICLQYLKERNIRIGAHLASVGSVKDTPFDPVRVSEETFSLLAERSGFPVLNEQAKDAMRTLIEEVRGEGDSIGGVIECAAIGLPAGLGEHMFDGVENRISALVFGIPGVKGIEFGEGFGASLLRGSENNDPFLTDGNRIFTATNRAGGILGGMTSGMPLIFRAAMKPTPSIFREQDSVDMVTMTPAKLTVKGRHDPCIALRAVPVMEAACAIAIYDLLCDSENR